jgi:hypothetical protein
LYGGRSGSKGFLVVVGVVNVVVAVDVDVAPSVDPVGAYGIDWPAPARVASKIREAFILEVELKMFSMQ